MRALTAAVVLIGGCTPSIDIHRVEDAPVAVILTPGDGEAVAEGPVELRGVASDEANRPEHLFVQWSLGTADDAVGWEPACKAFAAEDGASLCTADLRREHTRVRMLVKDLAGFEDEEIVSVVVDAVERPEVTFDAPLPPGPLYANVPVLVSLRVSDADDAPTGLSVTLVSSLQGALAVPSAPDLGGLLRGTVSLIAGVHTLEALVTDPGGNTGRAEVVVAVDEQNLPPTCRFVDAARVVAPYSTTAVRAAVIDDHDAPSAILASLDGGEPLVVGADGYLSTEVAWGAAGPASATLTVTDAVGASSTCSLDVAVDAPPTILLDLPGPGAVVDLGAPVQVSGVVTDDLTAPSGLQIVVSSSLDGPSAPFAAGDDGAFATARALSVGTHTLTVTATDAQGQVGEATAIVEVRGQ